MTVWPYYEEDERRAAERVLASGKVNYWNGEEGRRFEEEFAAFHDAPYGVAVANGSLAIELALIALGVGEGDDVIVTPRSFLASVSSVVLRGARPVFADVDEDSQNITADSIRRVLTPATKAVLAVHLAGWPCDMDALSELCRERGLLLIEDCAQAHGARWRGRPVGSFGDAAAFSFCTDKIMTMGEGGMLLLKEERGWSRAWSYKDHGKSWDAVYNAPPSDLPTFRWVHESFGSNWRLTEMQSAIGRVQLRKLTDWLKRRRANAQVLSEGLSKWPALRVPFPPEQAQHTWYKFYAFVRPDRLAAGWTRDRIIQSLNERGVSCMQGACPEIYLEKAFDGSGLRPEHRLPIAQRLGETSLMFQVHPTLTPENMKPLVGSVDAVMAQASRA